MANTLRFKRGLVSTIPTALAGEPLFTTDTFDLYIGNGTGNTRFQKYIASGTTSQLLRGDGSLLTMPIVLTSPANGQVLKYNGTSWVNDSDAGITGSGTTNFLPKFTGASTLGNSLLQEGTSAIGLNVTPSAWGSSFRTALQVNNASLAGSSGSASYMSLMANAFLNSSAQYVYISSNFASRYEQVVGGHAWYTAPSGTAGNTISFTETARLTAGGNFIINNASVDNGLRFQVTGDGYFSGALGLGTSTLTAKLDIVSSTAQASADIIQKITYGTIGATAVNKTAIYISPITASAFDIANSIRHFETGDISLTASGANRYVYGSYYGIKLGTLTTTGVTGILTSHYHIHLGNMSSSTTSDLMYGIYVGTIAGGASGYGIHSNVESGAGRWNLYMNGTAANYINGSLSIGTTNTYSKLLINGGRPYVVLNSGSDGIVLGGSGASDVPYSYITTTNDGVQRVGIAFHTTTNATAGTEKMRLDASGNLGLGVTPSAWGSNSKPLQMADASIWGSSALTGYASVGGNYFYDGNYKYIKSSTATDYYQYAGEHVWRNAVSGTAGNIITFVQRMTLDASGNLLVGGTSVYGATITSYGSSTRSGGIGIRNSAGTAAGGIFSYAAGSGSGSTDIVVDSAGFMSISTGGSERHRFFSGGNVGLGTTTDAGFRLDVNGTMRVSGASTFGGNMYVGVATGTGRFAVEDSLSSTSQFTSTSLFTISNSDQTNNNWGTIAFTDGSTQGFSTAIQTKYTDHTNNYGELHFSTRGTSGLATRLLIDTTGAATFSSSVTASGSHAAGSFNALIIKNTLNSAGSGKLVWQGNAGNETWAIAQDQLVGTGYLEFNHTGTNRMVLTSGGNLGIAMTPSYKLDVTGEARVSNAIAIGTTPDTNKPFKILKNINGTVGINFENTSTGASAFSAIQMGTDVTGGTKFTNLVYSSSGVTASGVYQPDGTSLINNGAGGLNFLGNPIRMYTGGSNGSLRWDMTNDGFITQYTGTNPSTNATDGYRQYSADVVAGNAAPHFRTENGAVIKLYQETTAVGNAIISLGGGNAVLDDTTFDGYTLRQIVKALRNQGILA